MVNEWDRVNAILRTEHAAGVSWMTGGYGWACSCGKAGYPGTGYPTEKRAAARLDRHLQSERRKIQARVTDQADGGHDAEA